MKPAVTLAELSKSKKGNPGLEAIKGTLDINKTKRVTDFHLSEGEALHLQTGGILSPPPATTHLSHASS